MYAFICEALKHHSFIFISFSTSFITVIVQELKDLKDYEQQLKPKVCFIEWLEFITISNLQFYFFSFTLYKKVKPFYQIHYCFHDVQFIFLETMLFIFFLWKHIGGKLNGVDKRMH